MSDLLARIEQLVKGAPDLIARMERAEAEVARLADEVALLRAERAGPLPPHDPIRWRRVRLRQLWREHYAALSRLFRPGL